MCSQAGTIQDLTPGALPGLEWFRGLPRKGAFPCCREPPPSSPPCPFSRPRSPRRPRTRTRRRGRGPASSCGPLPASRSRRPTSSSPPSSRAATTSRRSTAPRSSGSGATGGRASRRRTATPGRATTKIERRFTAHHVFQFAGLYRMKVTLRKSGKDIMSQTVQVTVRAGLGDISPEPGTDGVGTASPRAGRAARTRPPTCSPGTPCCSSSSTGAPAAAPSPRPARGRRAPCAGSRRG